MSRINLLLLVLLLWLQYSLWFSKNGVQDYIYTRYRLTELQSKNEIHRKRNDQLLSKIESLKVGQEGIEERARIELGMIKPDETFYRLVPSVSTYSEEMVGNS